MNEFQKAFSNFLNNYRMDIGPIDMTTMNDLVPKLTMEQYVSLVKIGRLQAFLDITDWIFNYNGKTDDPS